jgi:hypothetical protein
MLMWLVKWRQTVGLVVLVSLVWGSGVLGRPEAQERLGGWWLAQEQGRGHWPHEWDQHRLVVPLWLVQGWAWAEAGGWLGVMISVGWLSWREGGNLWSWGVLTLVSHQVRTAVGQVADLRRWEAMEMAWGEVLETVSVTEPPGWLTLARLAPTPEPGRGNPLEPTAEPGAVSLVAQTPAEVMGQSLVSLVEDLPIGTNLGLLLFLWMMVSGQLLPSRGAIFPALQQVGLSAEESRRVWAAFAEGKWQISDLLAQWQQQVKAEGVWQEHRLGGYRVKAVDLTGFWRPTLQNCPSRHFKAEAGQAVPAIVLGLVTRVGQVGSQRVPLPCQILRVDPDDPREAQLISQLLQQVNDHLAEDELVILDAGFDLKELLSVGLDRFLVRLARNVTARRNYLPEYQGQGRPSEHGDLVRPLARTYKGRTIAATPPDRQESWSIEIKGQPLSLTADFWDNLVLTDQKPGADRFNIIAIHDPRYAKPLLLATPLNLDGATLQALYADRWPVEQLPLSPKQMIGAARQFVHADESVQRLPELSLLAGAILTYVAAKLPPFPTGFWDRAPKATPGRLRRVLTGRPFPAHLPLPARIRRKSSVTAHLLKGILAHRRQKRSD